MSVSGCITRLFVDWFRARISWEKSWVGLWPSLSLVLGQVISSLQSGLPPVLDLFLCEVDENYPRVNLLADEGRKIHASKPLVVLRFYPPNSLANSGEDTIMVETSPICKCILYGQVSKPWWGREPTSWCKFPITGNFNGLGGRFEVVLLVLDIFSSFSIVKIKTRKARKIWKVGNSSSMIRSIQRTNFLLTALPSLIVSYKENSYHYYLAQRQLNSVTNVNGWGSKPTSCLRELN